MRAGKNCEGAAAAPAHSPESNCENAAELKRMYAYPNRRTGIYRKAGK